MSVQLRLDRRVSDEPSLAMSFGLLCVVLLAMFAIVVNISVPDVQFAPADRVTLVFSSLIVLELADHLAQSLQRPLRLLPSGTGSRDRRRSLTGRRARCGRSQVTARCA
jgi:hypothetical protein